MQGSYANNWCPALPARATPVVPQQPRALPVHTWLVSLRSALARRLWRSLREKIQT